MANRNLDKSKERIHVTKNLDINFSLDNFTHKTADEIAKIVKDLEHKAREKYILKSDPVFIFEQVWDCVNTYMYGAVLETDEEFNARQARIRESEIGKSKAKKERIKKLKQEAEELGLTILEQ